MQNSQALREHLNRITQDLAGVKKILINIETIDAEKAQRAWDDLMLASREISQRWEGPSVVEEINLQREKL